jgi:DNA-binding transcriptional regulator YhcF (GntR family)
LGRNVPLEALTLTRDAPVPLHRQLYDGLRHLIQERTLTAGTGLPSTRVLALDLAIARNTVVAAYDQLAAEGYIIARPRARPTVVDLPITPRGERQDTALAPGRKLSRRGELMIRQPVHHGAPGQLAFHPGMPDADSFPFSTWGRLIAKHARFARGALFGTYYVTGYPDLRRAIASFLKASRGVRCDPEQIVVTTGAQAALDLLARLLLDRGDTVWMEEPGYYGAQAAFTAAGAELAPLFVGESGWSLEQPPGPPPRLIYVTPSCQHPMGATMPMHQRLRLLQIAEARDAGSSKMISTANTVSAASRSPRCRVSIERSALSMSARSQSSCFLRSGSASWFYRERSPKVRRVRSASPGNSRRSSCRRHSPISSKRATWRVICAVRAAFMLLGVRDFRAFAQLRCRTGYASFPATAGSRCWVSWPTGWTTMRWRRRHGRAG